MTTVLPPENMPVSVEELERQLAQARADYDEAIQLQRAVIDERDEALRVAKREVEQRFQARLGNRSKEVSEASERVRQINDVLAKAKAKSDPDVGRKVARLLPGRWSWNETKAQYGVVEIITPDSEQPERIGGGYNYRKLPVGTKAIRLLKADGKPGKTVERFATFDTINAKRAESGMDPLTEDQAKRYWRFVD